VKLAYERQVKKWTKSEHSRFYTQFDHSE